MLANIATSIPDDTNYGSASSGHPSPTTTSSDDSICLTPTDSRRPSISMPMVTARHQPHVTAPRPRSAKRPASPEDDLPYCRDCDAVVCRDREKHGKRLKERKNRKLERDVNRDAEIILKLLGGWSSEKEQSKGNGNSAGLFGDKLRNHRATVGGFQWLAERAYLQAWKEGRLEEYLKEFAFVADRASEYGPMDGGVLLDLDGKRCEHHEKHSECIVHGHSDWRQCYIERSRANFEANLAAATHQEQARL
ncbi:hypothetical protein LTR85_006702 [Meristemomyces frigidus]|nr:hypothetical protein LTR85_006702 [Meristemomyces frigidus]